MLFSEKIMETEENEPTALLFFLPGARGTGENLVIFIFGFDNKNNKKNKATTRRNAKRVLSKQHLRNVCCPEQQNATNKLSSHQMLQVRSKS